MNDEPQGAVRALGSSRRAVSGGEGGGAVDEATREVVATHESRSRGSRSES